MKKALQYITDLFKKIDICFFLIFIFLVIFAHYCNAKETTNHVNQLFLVSMPILLAIVNLGNFKMKVNLADVLSVVFLFIYFYFAIRPPFTGNNIFSIVITLILLFEILFKAFRFENSEHVFKNQSKEFFSRLNYRFPIVALIIIGYALAFCMHYILQNTSDVFRNTFYLSMNVMSSIIVSLLYLGVVHILDTKHISILDYFYFIFACFLSGTVLMIYPTFYEYSSLFAFFIPTITIFFRAYQFEGDAIHKKKKYVSSLLNHYHFLAPYTIGFGCVILIVFTRTNSLFGLGQNIFLAIISLICVGLSVSLILMKGIKTTEIHVMDEVLLILISILFYMFIYLLAISLNLYGDQAKNALFSDMISLIGVFILSVCFVFCGIIYYIRYKNFLKSDGLEEEVEDEDIEAEEQGEVMILEMDDCKNILVGDGEYPTIVVPSKISGLDYYHKLMFLSYPLKKIYSDLKNYILSYGMKNTIQSNEEIYSLETDFVKTSILDEMIFVQLVTWQSIEVYDEISLDQCKALIDEVMLKREIVKMEEYLSVDYTFDLIPNGSAILGGLGLSRENIVQAINAKKLPEHLPEDLRAYVPKLSCDYKQDQEMVEIYLDTLCNFFPNRTIITKELLVEKQLLKENQCVFVKARGTLDKEFTIYADQLDEEAIQMIYMTNGTVILIESIENEES